MFLTSCCVWFRPRGLQENGRLHDDDIVRMTQGSQLRSFGTLRGGDIAAGKFFSN